MNNFSCSGYLGNDVNMRQVNTANGTRSVADFSISVRAKRNANADGTHPGFWLKVTVWGEAAENAAKFLKKGSPVLCGGSLMMENFTKKDGTQGSALVLDNAWFELVPRTNTEASTPVNNNVAQAPAAAAPQSYVSMDDPLPF